MHNYLFTSEFPKGKKEGKEAPNYKKKINKYINK